MNKKISTPVGIVVLLAVSLLVGWLILNQYRQVVETRFKSYELEPH